MGLSVSASAAIFFTTFLVIFGILFASFNDLNDSLSGAQTDEFSRYTDIKNTHIAITDVDPAQGTISLINDGSVTISIDDMDVLVNGTPCTDLVVSTEVDGNMETNIWAPNEELVLTLSSNMTGARVKVVTANGAMAYYG
jgi:flagellar protein FlaF